MITIENLSMAYGQRLLFDDVNLNLQPGNRYSVVGANGTGKSTFLKILASSEEPSLGTITISNYLKIGWLKQDHFQYEENSVLDAVIRGDNELWVALVEKEQLIQADIWNDETGMRLGTLEELIAHHDGYTAEARAENLLIGLGIPQITHAHPLKELSGGNKLRVLLAQALFNNPDILLLDEPTNHLDILSIGWLEEYLKNNYRGLLLFISHDYSFLNGLSTHVLDCDYGDIRLYVGNYKSFEDQKVLVAEQIKAERLGAEKKVAHLQTFVDRFRYKATKARQAQSKMKMIDKIELPDIEHSSRRAPNLNFNQKRPSGKVVVKAHNIHKSFGDKHVLKNVTFTIARGEKVFFLGHNGIGKSTVLKILQDLLPADQGTVEWGFETTCSYFAQDHHEQLNHNSDLLAWLEDNAAGKTTTQVRATLGHMLFSKDEVYKNILSLSGGEGARLLLGRMMLEENNVLILDEPTNHLDLEAIDALAKALRDFEGTVLCVSHDRFFVNKIATRIIALGERGIKDYKGSYKEYLKQHGLDYLSKGWLETQQ